MKSKEFFSMVGVVLLWLLHILFRLALIVIGMLILQRWLCNISPYEEYVWYHGIWHALFFLPNWILSWFFDDVLYKAVYHTTAYNVWWWITIVAMVITTFSSSGRRDY